jgi:hypothetical protein
MLLLLLALTGCRVSKSEATTSTCDEDLSCVDASGEEGCEDCDTTCQLDHLPSDSADHVEGRVDYETLPPAGGDHNKCWDEWGIHTEELDPIHFVHNQEHGGVIFLYNCPDGCKPESDLLTQLVEELGVLTILGPYSDMDHRFAAVAWEHRIMMNCLDVKMLEAFYREHVDNGPESTASYPPDDCMD